MPVPFLPIPPAKHFHQPHEFLGPREPRHSPCPFPILWGTGLPHHSQASVLQAHVVPWPGPPVSALPCKALGKAVPAISPQLRRPALGRCPRRGKGSVIDPGASLSRLCQEMQFTTSSEVTAEEPSRPQALLYRYKNHLKGHFVSRSAACSGGGGKPRKPRAHTQGLLSSPESGSKPQKPLQPARCSQGRLGAGRCAPDQPSASSGSSLNCSAPRTPTRLTPPCVFARKSVLLFSRPFLRAENPRSEDVK